MFLNCIVAHCSRFTIFCCLNAQHFSSSWALAKREGKCWAWRATKYCDMATMSQDTTEKHCLSNEEWQLKILIIEYHILFCAIIHDFSRWNLWHWLKNRSFTDVARLAGPAGLRSWDLKIKAEFANLVSAPPAHSGQLGFTCQSQRRSWRWNIEFGWYSFERSVVRIRFEFV